MDEVEIGPRLYDPATFKERAKHLQACAFGCGRQVRLEAGGDCFTILDEQVVCDACAAIRAPQVLEAVRANRRLLETPGHYLEIRDSIWQSAEVSRLKTQPCGPHLGGALDNVGLLDHGRFWLLEVRSGLLVCRECEAHRCKGDPALEVLKRLRSCTGMR